MVSFFLPMTQHRNCQFYWDYHVQSPTSDTLSCRLRFSCNSVIGALILHSRILSSDSNVNSDFTTTKMLLDISIGTQWHFFKNEEGTYVCFQRNNVKMSWVNHSVPRFVLEILNKELPSIVMGNQCTIIELLISVL